MEGIIPNPKLKLMDQVREVLRLKHYSIGTERSYCEWIRRYIKLHQMHLREELTSGEAKIEMWFSDLAVRGQAAASSVVGQQDAALYGRRDACCYINRDKKSVTARKRVEKSVKERNGEPNVGGWFGQSWVEGFLIPVALELRAVRVREQRALRTRTYIHRRRGSAS